MTKIHTGITICILMLFWACASQQFQNPSEYDLSLDQLINHLPAKDFVDQTLLFKAILEHGQDGLIRISEKLDSENPSIVNQAKWALNGLANYVTEKGNEDQRRNYINGLKESLDLPLHKDSKAFIINQFQIAGDEESVSTLVAYSRDRQLYEPAIAALTVIGGKEAGKALLSALPAVTGDMKISLLQALGIMRYEPAGKEILSLITDSNPETQDMAGFALANMGYYPANAQLRLLAEKDDRFVSSYLRLAERLGEKGDVESCLGICIEIINNEKGNYSDNRIINALRLGIKYDPDRIREYLIKIIFGPDDHMRVAALQMVADDNMSDFVSELVSMMPGKTPDVQEEMIEMLGRGKSKAMLLFLRESLKSSSSRIRMRSMKILVEKHDMTFLPDILQVMQDSLTEDEVNQVGRVLLTDADSLTINYLVENFNNFPIPSKTMLITILSKREELIYLPLFKESLNAGDPGLCLAGVESLGRRGDDASVDELVLFLFNSDDDSEQAAAVRAISSIIKRSASQEKLITLIKGYYENTSDDKKILLFKIFKAIGSTELMNITVREARNSQSQIHEAAIHTLAEWPDPEVLDILIDIGKNDRDERLRIIALRGALQLLKETPIGDQHKISIYKKLINTTTRPEEKRLILAGLSEIKTTSSLELITSVLNDSDVNYEAFLAALKVSSASEGDIENLSRDEIVSALIGAHADGVLKEKLNLYTQNHIITPQPPEGFKALFNGINLDGWKGLVENPVKRTQMSEEELRAAQAEADKIMREHWHVIDGILYFDGKGSHLCTVDEFTDFEMFVDWKIEKDGDTGIYLRGSPQVQIWDPAYNPEGSGGLYNNQTHPNKPLKKADNPIGDWNTFHIIMRGEQVTVYLNDVLVVDHVLMENYWERDKPIYPIGQIELQSHNTPLYFRKIYIKELEPVNPLFNGNLFNGKDLTGWQIIDGSPGSWQVKDSILYTDGHGGGWISTVAEYADFILNLEFRVSEGGNSGVFLRAPHQGDPAYTGMEIQILDDYSEQYADLQKWQYTGSVYGLQAPFQRTSKKADVWQIMNIVCIGPEVKVSLNDIPVINANLIDFMHQEKEHPGIKRRTGYIGLQNHGTRIEFRNIFLTEVNQNNN